MTSHAPSSRHDRCLAIYYEHPEWFTPSLPSSIGVRSSTIACWLMATMTSRSSSAVCPCRQPHEPSAYARPYQALFYTLHYLAFLKEIGANVLNGYDAYVYEFSKARQLGLLHRLGLPYPRTRVINHPSQAPIAAGLTFPVILKPNIGGSGAKIVRSRPQRNCDRRRQAVRWTWGSITRARAGVLTGGRQHCAWRSWG